MCPEFVFRISSQDLYFTFSTESDGLFVIIRSFQPVTSVSPFEEVSWYKTQEPDLTKVLVHFVSGSFTQQQKKTLIPVCLCTLFSGQVPSVRYSLELISISRRTEQSVSASSNVPISNVFYRDNGSFASTAISIKSRSLEKIISSSIVIRRAVLRIYSDYSFILL